MVDTFRTFQFSDWSQVLFVSWMITCGLYMSEWLLARVLEYPSVSQYPFWLVPSALLHRSPRMCVSSCTLVLLLYSIPFSYLSDSPFRRR